MLVSTVTGALGAPNHGNEKETIFHIHGGTLKEVTYKKHVIF